MESFQNKIFAICEEEGVSFERGMFASIQFAKQGLPEKVIIDRVRAVLKLAKISE